MHPHLPGGSLQLRSGLTSDDRLSTRVLHQPHERLSTAPTRLAIAPPATKATVLSLQPMSVLLLRHRVVLDGYVASGGHSEPALDDSDEGSSSSARTRRIGIADTITLTDDGPQTAGDSSVVVDDEGVELKHVRKRGSAISKVQRSVEDWAGRGIRRVLNRMDEQRRVSTAPGDGYLSVALRRDDVARDKVSELDPRHEVRGRRRHFDAIDGLDARGTRTPTTHSRALAVGPDDSECRCARVHDQTHVVADILIGAADTELLLAGGRHDACVRQLTLRACWAALLFLAMILTRPRPVTSYSAYEDTWPPATVLATTWSGDSTTDSRVTLSPK